MSIKKIKIDNTEHELGTTIANVDGLQDALNGKASSSHTHNYAGSSSAGGSATSAVKLDSSAGSSTQPVYFSSGKPVACSYTLAKSVPSDAVFTDTNTTYSAGTGISLSGTTFSNSGVRSISTGSTNGTISVNTNGTSAEVAVNGLGSAAYTASSAYATSGHTHDAATSSALGFVKVGSNITVSSGTISLTKANVVAALGYTPPTSDTNTTYNVVTASAAGLVPAFDAADGTIDSSSTDWVLTNNNGSIGWYKLPANAFNNTTYSAATSSAAGLMSASDKSKLDAITASADSVAFSQSLTSGTQVGTLTINGTATKLYAPTNTDTHYTTGLKVGDSASATANAAASNGSVYLNVLDNSTVRDSHKITGSGSVTVASDSSGNITISGTDTNTTYSAATTSAAGLMSAADKSKLDGISFTDPTFTGNSGNWYGHTSKGGTGNLSYTRYVNSSGTLLGGLGFMSQNTPAYRTSGGSTNYLIHSGNVSEWALPMDGEGTDYTTLDRSIDLGMGVIRFTDGCSIDMYAYGNYFEILKDDDDYYKTMFSIDAATDTASINGYDVLTTKNSTAVIVTSDNSTTPDVDSYGLWAY